MKEDAIGERMVNRGERRAFQWCNSNEGLFLRPLTCISRDVQGLFQTKAEELGIPNPFEQAADVISRIQEVLIETSLDGRFISRYTKSI